MANNPHWVPRSKRLREQCIRAYKLNQEGFTLVEVAKILGVHESTSYRWVRAGHLLLAAEVVSPGLSQKGAAA